MTALELSGVTKRFRHDTVLEGVDLRVDEGETLVIFGPSGSGKTVLLRVIAGVEDPNEGAVLIDGHDMVDAAPEARGVGMAFQNFALFPHMSAFDNIASPLKAKRSSADKVSEGVHAVARLLKIDHVLDHAPRALSNGQKQRTALARALAAKPKILLLDDPLRNVDAKLRFEMRLELPRLLAGYGSTVLYVTQDYKEAMALGDRIAVLGACNFIQVATPEEIYLRPATLEVARLFGDPTINLLPVTPVAAGDGTQVLVAGAQVRLGGGATGAEGRDCLLGVRPEALGFCDAGMANAVPMTVEAVTPLNEKVVSLLAGPDELELLVSRPSEEEVPPPGANVHVALPPQALLLFDRETGARIDREAGGAGAGT